MITYWGMLWWSPIPSFDNRFPLRCLFVALEATFTWAFWIVFSCKWEFMHSFCPWPVDSFAYDGFRSHTNLSEKVHGDTLNFSKWKMNAFTNPRNTGRGIIR